MKVKLITSLYTVIFETSLNTFLAELETTGHKVIDIKYAIDMDKVSYFSALVMYE